MEEKQSFFKKYFNVKTIVANGMVAALYFAITVACTPLSYGVMQFRFSELLNLLVFFNPTYTLGLTLGCLLANLFSSPIDILIGTCTTFVACILMIIYSKFIKNLFSTGLIPCFANAATVPFTIYLASLGTSNAFVLSPEGYFIMFGWVLLGELVCIMGIGYPMFMVLCKKTELFSKMILAIRNIDFKW